MACLQFPLMRPISWPCLALALLAACGSENTSGDAGSEDGVASDADAGAPAETDEGGEGAAEGDEGEAEGGEAETEGDEGDEEECVPSERLDPTYDPPIDPAQFSPIIDHPLMAMLPGARWVLQNAEETITIEVLNETREVMGVTCAVVHDVAALTATGEAIEDTFDWFAQDSEGNVWYFGEDSKEMEGGQVVSSAGSWEAGVDGAKPGIIMLAAPAVGDVYRQEYYVCEAEDMADVVALSEVVSVPAGEYQDCLQTHDYTSLEPDANEHKFYCPGVGITLEVDMNSGERTELVEFTPGAAP